MKKLIIQCLKLQSAGVLTIQNYLKENGYNPTINEVNTEIYNLIKSNDILTLGNGQYTINA